MNRPSFLRDLVGFLVGGIVAAVATALVFMAFHAMFTQGRRHDHPPDALMSLAGAMFFAGGLIGRRGISADYYSDVFRPVIGTYLVFGFFCVIACFGSSVDHVPISFIEIASTLGFVTAGVVASVAVSLLLFRWFPPKTDHDEVDT